MYMDRNNIFANRLKGVLAVTGVERGELARYLGVSVPTVNRWLNGTGTPNVYQFQELARYFGMSYDWFLDPDGGQPDAGDLAVKLGLSHNGAPTQAQRSGLRGEKEGQRNGADARRQAGVAEWSLSRRVEALLELADSESEDVLAAVDDAVCAVIGVVNAVYDDLLRVAGNAAGEMEERRK